MSTPNLGITHIAAAQSQKEVTANAAFDYLDKALCGRLSKTLSDSDCTLTAEEALSNLVFVFTGTITASRNVIVPVNKKPYIVSNQTAYPLVVKTAAGTGITILPIATNNVHVYCDGTNVVAVASVDTDRLLTNNSDAVVPTQKAVKGHIDLKTFPTPNKAVFAYWRVTNAISGPFDVWFDVLTAGSSCTSSKILTSATENASYHVSVPGGNPTASMSAIGTYQFYSGRKCILETKIIALSGLTGYRVWAAFVDFDNNLYNTDSSVGRGKLIGFRFNSDTQSNWICCVGSSAAIAETDSGIAPSTSAAQTLRIEIDGTQAMFYINGTLVATMSTNYPANTPMAMYFGFAGNSIGGTNGVGVQYMYGECAAP